MLASFLTTRRAPLLTILRRRTITIVTAVDRSVFPSEPWLEIDKASHSLRVAYPANLPDGARHDNGASITALPFDEHSKISRRQRQWPYRCPRTSTTSS